MVAWLVAQVLLTAAPHCSLFAGTEHVQGRGELAVHGMVGVAATRTAYSLSASGYNISAQTFGTPRLMSVTWKPSDQANPVTMTCTQKPEHRFTPRGLSPYVVCIQQNGKPMLGRGELSYEVNDLSVRVRADSQELRISATDLRFGFVAAWRERLAGTLAPLLLQTGVQKTLCLVL
jgi:hypothetical protein